MIKSLLLCRTRVKSVTKSVINKRYQTNKHIGDGDSKNAGNSDALLFVNLRDIITTAAEHHKVELVKVVERKENEKMELLDRLVKEQMALQKELLDRLVKEQMALQKELLERKENEKRALVMEQKDLEKDLERAHETALRLRGRFNVRGAVEYARAMIAAKARTQYTYSEPWDKTLARLQQDKVFREDFESSCAKVSLRLDDAQKCLGGLYHTLSKEHHGLQGDVCVDARDFTQGEVVALITLFRYTHIPFTYKDAGGLETNPPF